MDEKIKKYSPRTGEELIEEKYGYYREQNDDLLYRITDSGDLTPLISPVHNGHLELGENDEYNKKGLLRDPHCGIWHKVMSDGEIKTIMISRDGTPIDPQDDKGLFLDSRTQKWVKVIEGGKRVTLVSPLDNGTLSINENEVYNECGIFRSESCGYWHKLTDDGKIIVPKSPIRAGEALEPIDNDVFIKNGIMVGPVFCTLHKVSGNGEVIPLRSEVNGAFLLQYNKEQIKNNIFTDENRLRFPIVGSYKTEEERIATQKSSAWYRLSSKGEIVPLIREREGTRLEPAEKIEHMEAGLFFDPQYGAWNHVDQDGIIRELNQVYEVDNKLFSINPYTSRGIMYEQDQDGNYSVIAESRTYTDIELSEIKENASQRKLVALDGAIIDMDAMGEDGKPKVCYEMNENKKYVSKEILMDLPKENVQEVANNEELFQEAQSSERISFLGMLGKNVRGLATRYSLGISDVVNKGVKYLQRLEKTKETDLDIQSPDI